VSSNAATPHARSDGRATPLHRPGMRHALSGMRMATGGAAA
jgi:hypothetical protein